MQLEVLAYLASKAVNGKMVKIVNSREDDIKTSPCKIGVEAYLKLGATKDGIIKVLKARYMVDGGAYVDISPRMAKAIAVDCSDHIILKIYGATQGVFILIILMSLPIVDLVMQNIPSVWRE